MNPAISGKDVEWATDIFRPLLKELSIQQPKSEITVLKAADFRNLIILGMGRCVITLQIREISENNQGYFVLSYKQDKQLFILAIVLSKNLFTDNSIEKKRKRKALGVHEFVHCISALLSISPLGIGSDQLIERIKDIFAKKVQQTTSEDLANLMTVLGKIADKRKREAFELFNDRHYRTGFEDFPDDYAELFFNLLMSYKLLLELITPTRLKQISEYAQDADKTNELMAILVDIIDELLTQKALKKDFVITRLAAFLPRLVAENIK